ncbi:MAG: DUF4102 domain-containing protein [Sphingomonadaceae bacterium]|nr:DUF4102 domain-containing protein [Sphingomonadaceae bacterium]
MKFNVLSHLMAKRLAAGKYADGQGLWLVKRNSDFGQWVLRLTRYGQRREMGLGRWPDVSIAEARERAAEFRRQWRDGIDPIDEREKSKCAARQMTVAEAIASCFEARKAELKGDGEAGKWMSPLENHIIPKIGKLPITKLDQHKLKEAVDPIWHSKADAAAKAVNRVNLTLRHAAALGLDVDLQAAMKARALL